MWVYHLSCTTKNQCDTYTLYNNIFSIVLYLNVHWDHTERLSATALTQCTAFFFALFSLSIYIFYRKQINVILHLKCSVFHCLIVSATTKDRIFLFAVIWLSSHQCKHLLHIKIYTLCFGFFVLPFSLISFICSPAAHPSL